MKRVAVESVDRYAPFELRLCAGGVPALALMLFLMLGLFRAVSAAESPRRRHALAVFVLAFFLIGHFLFSF